MVGCMCRRLRKLTNRTSFFLGRFDRLSVFLIYRALAFAMLTGGIRAAHANSNGLHEAQIYCETAHRIPA